MREAFEPVYATLERTPQTADFIARIEELKASTDPGPALDMPADCTGSSPLATPAAAAVATERDRRVRRSRSTAPTAGRSPRMMLREHGVSANPARIAAVVPDGGHADARRRCVGRVDREAKAVPSDRRAGTYTVDGDTCQLRPRSGSTLEFTWSIDEHRQRRCRPVPPTAGDARVASSAHSTSGNGSTGDDDVRRSRQHGVVGRHLPLDDHQGRRTAHRPPMIPTSRGAGDLPVGVHRHARRRRRGRWSPRRRAHGDCDDAAARTPSTATTIVFAWTEAPYRVHVHASTTTAPCTSQPAGPMPRMATCSCGRRSRGSGSTDRPRVSPRLVAERKLGDEARSAAGRLATSSVPPSASTRSMRLRSPVPAAGRRHRRRRRAISTVTRVVRHGHGDRRLRRRGVLGDVGQRLRADEVHRRLDVVGKAARERHACTGVGHRAASASSAPASPALGEQPRVEPGGQRPQLVEGRRRAARRFPRAARRPVRRRRRARARRSVLAKTPSGARLRPAVEPPVVGAPRRRR